jgi:glutathione S-transferase
MTRPILYVFAISHYCEKARWALDHYGIEYDLKYTMPGANRRIAKKLGAKSGSLPFLQTSNGVVTGSDAIIDWGEVNCQPDRTILNGTTLNGGDFDAVRSLEKRLDDVTGVHVRRYYYSDALLNNPASVRPIISGDLPFLQRLGMRAAWPKIVPVMIKLMDLGLAQGLESRDLLLAELDWLDGMLADGRPFLGGDTLSRADITAASLLAPLVNPPQHPTYSALALPTALAETIAGWQDRPTLKWVAQMYRQFR